MMQHFHAMFSLELLALVSGVFLLIFLKNQTKVTSGWATFTAWFVIIFSALLIICSVIQTIRFWNNPYQNSKAMEMMEMNKQTEQYE
jgi:hypothetical protein